MNERRNTGFSYDAKRRRMTHLPSGMAIEYRSDDYPRENRRFMTLLFEGKEYPFETNLISNDWPFDFSQDLTIHERMALVRVLSEANFCASRVDARFDRRLFVRLFRQWLIKEFPEKEAHNARYIEWLQPMNGFFRRIFGGPDFGKFEGVLGRWRLEWREGPTVQLSDKERFEMARERMKKQPIA